VNAIPLGTRPTPATWSDLAALAAALAQAVTLEHAERDGRFGSVTLTRGGDGVTATIEHEADGGAQPDGAELQAVHDAQFFDLHPRLCAMLPEIEPPAPSTLRVRFTGRGPSDAEAVALTESLRSTRMRHPGELGAVRITADGGGVTMQADHTPGPAVAGGAWDDDYASIHSLLAAESTT